MKVEYEAQGVSFFTVAITWFLLDFIDAANTPRSSESCTSYSLAMLVHCLSTMLLSIAHKVSHPV